MSNLVLVRVDERLIHGCVCTTWAPTTGAENIVAIDDITAANSFISKIMTNSAQTTAKCPASILTMADALESWKKDQFSGAKTLLIFKNIDDAYYAFENGLEYSSLQLGWMNPTKDRIKISESMNLSSSDVEKLRELAKKVDIYFQYSLQFDMVPFEDGIKGKF